MIQAGRDRNSIVKEKQMGGQGRLSGEVTFKLGPKMSRNQLCEELEKSPPGRGDTDLWHERGEQVLGGAR